jgi:hypothetical protein
MVKRFGPLLVIAVSALVIHFGTDALAASKGPEVGTQGQSTAEQGQAMRALHARLSASARAAEHHTVELTAGEVNILANPGVDATGRLRVGVHRTVGRSVSNGKSDLSVKVPGAVAIRLELTDVKGTVAVFNDAGQAHEYTEGGFTHTFSGDEVRVRGSARVAGVGAVNLGGNLCDFNAWCTENAACVDIPAAIDAARPAYASILFKSGPFYYICSGGLIADSDASTEIPYFLTANHCVSGNREANSLETFFHYVQSSCQAVSCALPAAFSTKGATIIATNRTGDYTLLRLSQDPPTGSVFLGWSDTPVAFSSGTDLYRISHPGGAPQAYSEHSVDASAPTCRSWPRGERIYSRDIFGATEGGSSGSPVLNAGAEIVGQLTGTCGFNVYDDCDAVNNATVDGAFASYYEEVQPFLGDGAAGCSVDSDCDDGDLCTTDVCAGGVCSNTPIDCDDGNACTADSCLSGACSNSPLSCDDADLCTLDSCDPASGCANDPIDCADADICTTDSCDPGTGLCAHDPISCDDGNVCTDDSCDPALGCVQMNNANPCDDGDVCTLDDTCSGGFCSGYAKDCSDGSLCTDDLCDPVTGSCSNPPVDCSDGIDCTLDSCDLATGECLHDDSACSDTLCGNGVCEGNGEDCFECPEDCDGSGRNNSKSCCGNGTCEGNKEVNNCPVDCGF